MELGAAGLLQQPFPTHGKPLEFISYGAAEAALEALRETCDNPTGLSLLQGPSLSGKSTLIRTFVDSLHHDSAVAVVNGTGLNTTNLLISVMHHFGYDVELSSANELLGLVRVFVLQQAAAGEPPLLIIENAHELNPSALRALCELAALRVQACRALKLVLVSDRSLATMMAAPAMEPMSKRILHDFHLGPMTRNETQDFLHSKLRAAGANNPELIFPDEVCGELWKASAGWPGITDRIALLALARATTLPVAVNEIEHPTLPSGTWDKKNVRQDDIDPPQLIVSIDGKGISKLTMGKSRCLVGRSELNDISIESRFISRHHAMLVRHGASTFLMDLNSTNGTFVNSKRISNYVLIHDDVITVGHHRIRFSDPHATSRVQLSGDQFADTVIMKTLEDMRNLLAQENTSVMPVATDDLMAAASENLPTLQ